jgi:hypothetical protein
MTAWDELEDLPSDAVTKEVRVLSFVERAVSEYFDEIDPRNSHGISAIDEYVGDPRQTLAERQPSDNYLRPGTHGNR